MRAILVLLLFALPFYVTADRRALLLSKKPVAGGGFTPSDVSGLVFWLNVDDLSGSNGDAIQTFPDYTANNHDFSHATAGNRPLLTNSTSVLNNKKSLWFDGSADQLTNKTYTLAASDYTFYAVFKFRAAYHDFSGGYLLDDATGTTEMSIRAHDTSTHTFRVYDGTNTKDAGAVADTAARVVAVVMNSTGTALNVYTNGIIAGAAAAFAQPATANYLTLGAQQGGGVAHFNGIIADVLLYTGAHGTSDRQNVEDYLGTKFGITINH